MFGVFLFGAGVFVWSSSYVLEEWTWGRIAFSK